MSAGHSNDNGAARSGLVLLFALVIALAVATVWYVARPALDQKPAAERSCEVVILPSGSPSCVDPLRAAHAAASKHSKR